MKQSRDWRRLALGGAIQSLTVVPGNIAWGLAFGAAAGAAGIPAATSALFSAVAFSGTAQMATLGLLHGPLVAIFGTSLLVSLRFVPMTLYLAVEMAAQPRWRRALAAATMADASFALLTRVRQGHGSFLAGSFLVLYTSWLGGTLAGGLLASHLPAWGQAASEAVIGILFIYLTVEVCVTKGLALAAVGAGAAAIVLGLFVMGPIAILLAGTVVAAVAAIR